MKNVLRIISMTAILLFGTLFAGAQKMMLGAGAGYGTFSMSDTKDYNETIQNTLPFTPVLTDDFPGWFYFGGEMLYSFPKNIAAGITISTTSTGSRLHLADYSGEYTFDNLQRGWFPGVKVLLGKAPGQQNGLCFSAEAGMSFSSMHFDEKLLVYEEDASDQGDFSAHGFFIKPGVSYLQNLGQHLILSANVSYYLGFESGYFVNGHSDQKISNPETDEAIKPNWNGLRAGLVLYWATEL